VKVHEGFAMVGYCRKGLCLRTWMQEDVARAGRSTEMTVTKMLDSKIRMSPISL